MRILVDTNILISAILFPRSAVANALLYITENHSMVLCDQILQNFGKCCSGNDLTNYPNITWQIVKIEIGMIAILFFLSMAKNKNAKHGGTVNPNITTAFTIPI